jgi:hypothetical protein
MDAKNLFHAVAVGLDTNSIGEPYKSDVAYGIENKLEMVDKYMYQELYDERGRITPPFREGEPYKSDVACGIENELEMVDKYMYHELYDERGRITPPFREVVGYACSPCFSHVRDNSD